MAVERDRISVLLERERFIAAMQKIDPNRLVFLDESGANISMTRDMGRAPKGQRLIAKTPRNRGTVLTMLGAIRLDGRQALMTKVGGTTREVFLEFVREHLLALLKPGDVVVMDNLRAHHAKDVGPLIESVGATVTYMPPYSPDLNPIELAWSKLKSWLRRLGARTVLALRFAVHLASTALRLTDIAGWYAHCGYANQLK